MSSPPPSLGVRIAKVALVRIPFYLLLAASLLVFPAWLPWMIAVWLLLCGFQVWRDRRAWPPLAFCLGIVLVKRVDWPVSLMVLMFLMAATGVLDWKARKRLVRTAIPLLALSWAAMTWEWNAATHTSRRSALQEGRPIVCTGDSITAYGYPRLLAKRLRVPVIDHGQGGINTEQALARWPDLLALRPQAVVIEIGGHDLFQKRSGRQAMENIEKMIVAAREAGAEVVLFEIPRGFILDPFGGIDREVARKHDLELVADGAIRQLVLFSPFTPLSRWTGRLLSEDGLHPNDEGHVLLADRVEAALRRLYGDAILSPR